MQKREAQNPRVAAAITDYAGALQVVSPTASVPASKEATPEGGRGEGGGGFGTLTLKRTLTPRLVLTIAPCAVTMAWSRPAMASELGSQLQVFGALSGSGRGDKSHRSRHP